MTITNKSDIVTISKDKRTKKQSHKPGTGRKGEKMKYNIIIEGTRYNENYTFETPAEGDISEEIAAILEEIKKGEIDRVEIKSAETKEEAEI